VLADVEGVAVCAIRVAPVSLDRGRQFGYSPGGAHRTTIPQRAFRLGLGGVGGELAAAAVAGDKVANLIEQHGRDHTAERC